MKTKIAKIIRIVTAPPIVAGAMLWIFRCSYGDLFITDSLLFLEILFLCIVPVSAYPFASLKKGRKESVREQQRKSAFVFNLIGYFLALSAGVIGRCSKMLFSILTAYFMAVLVLTVLNKICKIRASGHACSCVLPYLFFCRWFGTGSIVLCAILYLAEFWASVKLKRHTVKEFLAGSVVAGSIFIIVMLLEILTETAR